MEIGVALVASVLAIGTVAGAILSTWTLTARVNRKLEMKIDKQIDEKFEKKQKEIEKEMRHEIEKLGKDLLNEIKAIDLKISNHFKMQAELHRTAEQEVELLKSSVLEAYKRSIRDVYYRLRQTGEISDVDMSYVDSIYPKYKALGGNSDIHAKYDEMRDVYSELTRQRFAEAREKAQSIKEDNENK